MLVDLLANSAHAALPQPLSRCRRGRLASLIALTASLAASLAACGPATVPRQAAADAPAAAAAAPSPAGTTALPANGATAPTKVEITFVDLDSFDKSVERALASGAPEVEVKLLAGMSPNQIAPRLGRWINTVQDNGGDVQVTGAPRTRSLGLLASLGELIYKAWNDARLQGLVKGVDAEMAMAGEKIQAVTFRRR